MPQKNYFLDECLSALDDNTKLSDIIMLGVRQANFRNSEDFDQCENGARFFDLTVKRYRNKLWDKNSNKPLVSVLEYIDQFIQNNDDEFAIIKFSIDQTTEYDKIELKTLPSEMKKLWVESDCEMVLKLKKGTNIADMKLKELRGWVIFLFDRKINMDSESFHLNMDSESFHQYRKHKNVCAFKESGLMICCDSGTLYEQGLTHNTQHSKITPHLFRYNLRNPGEELDWLHTQKLHKRYEKIPNIIFMPVIDETVGGFICDFNMRKEPEA